MKQWWRGAPSGAPRRPLSIFEAVVRATACSTYIGRRILQMIPVFIGVTILLFILRAPGVLPGDPVRMITGERAITEALYNQIVKENGLDKPLYVQYWQLPDPPGPRRPGRVVSAKGRPVTDDPLREVPQHAQAGPGRHHHRDHLRHCGRHHLGGQAVLVLGRAGDASARRSSSRMPVFWLGMLLQVLFGIKFKQWGLPYLPISGMTSERVPARACTSSCPRSRWPPVSTAYAARIMRSQLLEVMGQDYIRTASAKGSHGAPGDLAPRP